MLTSARVCAYTRLHPLTAVSGALHRFRFVRMRQDGDYFRTLSEAWRKGDGLTVLEHDNLAWGVGALESCAEPWCVRPYTYGERLLDQNLGLTSFSADLTLDYPDIWEDVAKAGGSWGQLDGPLASLLLGLGFVPHKHRYTWHAR